MFAAVASLVAGLANAEVHGILGFILTSGSLFALHKLTPEDQALRGAEKAKLRPVNVPCSFLKWGFQLLLETEEAEAAVEKMRPMQMGLGATNGVEVVAHLFRSQFERGHVVCTTDFSNGFNAFLRQAMLDAVGDAFGAWRGRGWGVRSGLLALTSP